MGTLWGLLVKSDRDVSFEHEVMKPSTIISVAWILLFIRIAKKAPDVQKTLVVDMAFLKRGWTKSVLKCF